MSWPGNSSYREVGAVVTRMVKLSVMGFLLMAGARAFAAAGVGILIRIGRAEVQVLKEASLAEEAAA